MNVHLWQFVGGPRGALRYALLLWTTSCGFSDGEKGSLRHLFEDELPPLEVVVQVGEGERDAGGNDAPTTRERPSDPTRPSTSPTTAASNVSPDTSEGPSVDPDLSTTSGAPTTATPKTSCENDTSGMTLGETCTVGVGACESVGEVVCSNRQLTCSARPFGSSTEECNGIDDDCDGETDEGSFGFCRVGSGGCEREGVWVCDGETRVCNAEVVLPVEELCNGIDDDCDGAVDEGLGVRDSCSVGIGACRRTGQNVCVDDAVACNVTAGTPTDETCNGIDDDCDGEADEGFDVGSACTVGLGACQGEGVIVCSAGAARCNALARQPGIELCNDIDDDCNGAVDDRHACPGDVIQNTKPFTEGIWYTASTSTCGRERVLQFWPTLNEQTYYSDFPCYSQWWAFRPTDGELFLYDSQGSGAFLRHVEGGTDEVLETQGCPPRSPFFFDDQNRVHYRCYSTDRQSALRRGEGLGEVLVEHIDALYAVTADGRSLVSLDAQLTLLDAAGETLATYDPAADFVGRMTLQALRVTVSGEDLFLLYVREYQSPGEWELVLFRIDAANELSLVRRLYLGPTAPSNNLLPLSDGSIFEETRDPETTSQDMIRRYAPDGTQSIVWRESETTFTTHTRDQMLIGPRL